MKAIKWLLTVLAFVFGLVAIVGCFAAIWVADSELTNRIGATAYVSVFLGVLTGFGAYFIWSEE